VFYSTAYASLLPPRAEDCNRVSSKVSVRRAAHTFHPLAFRGRNRDLHRRCYEHSQRHCALAHGCVPLRRKQCGTRTGSADAILNERNGNVAETRGGSGVERLCAEGRGGERAAYAAGPGWDGGRRTFRHHKRRKSSATARNAGFESGLQSDRGLMQVAAALCSRRGGVSFPGARSCFFRSDVPPVIRIFARTSSMILLPGSQVICPILA
jgi:hypothetical protein